jgi:hypothetical protein
VPTQSQADLSWPSRASQGPSRSPARGQVAPGPRDARAACGGPPGGLNSPRRPYLAYAGRKLYSNLWNSAGVDWPFSLPNMVEGVRK